MADNVAITAGSGTNVAADEATYSGDTAKIQLVRPVFVSGAEGSKAVTEPAFTTAGEQKVLAYRDLLQISVQSSGLSTGASYAAGDQLGSLFTLTNAARVSGGGGYVTGITLIDAADVIGAVDVVFFSASVTLAADNAAFAISDADALYVQGIVTLAGSFDIGNNRIAQAHSLAMPYICSGGTSLYAGLLTRSGHSQFAAATNLQLVVSVERV